MFASPRHEPRARRPTDVALLVGNAAVLGLLVLATRAGRRAEQGVEEVVSATPVLLRGLWDLGADLVVLWAVLLLVVAVLGRRLALARDLVVAAVVAFVSCTVVAAVASTTNVSVRAQLTASGGPPSFPALKLALATTVVVTASPHLARPLRYAGRWVLAYGALATLALGIARAGGVLTAITLAGAIAAAVHLVFGSPGGRPSLERVARMLAEHGLEVDDLQPAALHAEGVWVVRGRRGDGTPVRVQVYGRDAWDGQLVMSAWRFLWYRDGARTVAISRVQLVEHEALLVLLARQAGVAVPAVLAAGGTSSGDAILVTSDDATRLDELGSVDHALMCDLWHALDHAHASGVCLGRIDAESIGVDGAGRATFLDWSGGRTAPSEVQQLQDGAQLLVATAMTAGDEEAIAAAIDAIGTERLAALLPYLQAAGMSRALRKYLATRAYDIEQLRALASERLEVELPKLVQLRRVTVGSVLQLALLLFASLALIQALSAIDFAAVGDELRSMTLGAVVLGIVLAQIARSCGALSNQGASPEPLPFGPLFQLQFAIAYINMAVPSTAGRLALVVRFYQRVGSTAAVALGAGALDSFSNFIVQVILVVVTLVLGLGTIELSIDSVISGLPPNLAHLVVIVVAAFVAAVVVVLLVPSLRRRVMPTLDQFRAGLAVLRNPRNAALLFGGNLLVQVAYALALGVFVEATGFHVGIFDLLLIINLVGTFASLIPVPNGMGVMEAGLTAGLVAAGVPESAALAAALAYRVFSSYLPPVWGYFSMRWLQRHDYL